MTAALVSLLDVDNTLIDNDRVKADLVARIDGLVGPDLGAAFWQMYEEVRRERDFVDLPYTLERFRAAFPQAPNFPHVAGLILCYPFGGCLYPGALEVIGHLKAMGPAAILSDGDSVFQPAKIARSGLADAVDGNVLVYPHKEDHLDELARLLPADRYVLVDDKAAILATFKAKLADRVVTVHVRQGKYAGPAEATGLPRADIEIATIAELLRLSPQDFQRAVARQQRAQP